MNRGYIKFWRKAQDSASWNRGLVYQGLIINLLTRAYRKKTTYQGKELLPGQFGTVMGQLAESLGVPRSTLQRMVAHLVADEFLSVENMGNRFVVITIVNWDVYQEPEKTFGQPVGNRWATNGQPVGNAHNKNKKEEEEREEYYSARARVAPSVPENSPDPLPEEPKKTDSPSKGTPEWPAFNACFGVYPVQQGKEDAWREWMRLKENGVLPSSWEIRDAILTMAAQDSRWQRGMVPKFANWLRGKGWEDHPFIEPGAPAVMARDGPPAARTQSQKNRQDLEGLAAFVNAADKEFSHGYTPENRNGTGPDGRALPAPGG